MKYNRPDYPVAYCNKQHWPMSIRQIKYKGCTCSKKQRSRNNRCKWLVVYWQHPYWESKRKVRDDKKGMGR